MECGDEDLERWAERIGRAILLPMVRAIKDVAEGERIEERMSIVVKDWEEAQSFFKHLRRQGVGYKIIERQEHPKGLLITFSRLYQSTEDKIKMYLGGKTWKE